MINKYKVAVLLIVVALICGLTACNSNRLETAPLAKPIKQFSEYKPFSEIEFFTNFVLDNPIDKSYNDEMNDEFATYPIREIIKKYTIAWEKEIENAINLLDSRLETLEGKTALKNSQIFWEKSTKNEFNLGSEVFNQSLGDGSGHSILIEGKLLDETRMRALLLIEHVMLIQGNYDFIWI